MKYKILLIALAEAYAGWPDRLYIVGTDGNVYYQGRKAR